MHFQLFYKDKDSKTHVAETTTEELDATIESLYKEGNALLTIIPHSFKEEYHTVCGKHSHPSVVGALQSGNGCLCYTREGELASDSEEEILHLLDLGWQHQAVNPFTGPERSN